MDKNQKRILYTLMTEPSESNWFTSLVGDPKVIPVLQNIFSEASKLPMIIKVRIIVKILQARKEFGESYYKIFQEDEISKTTDSLVIQFLEQTKSWRLISFLLSPFLKSTNISRLYFKYPSSERLAELAKRQILKMGKNISEQEYEWLINKLKIEASSHRFYALIEKYVEYLTDLKAELKKRKMSFEGYLEIEKEIFEKTGITNMSYYPAWYILYLNDLYKNGELKKSENCIYFSSSHDWNHSLKVDATWRNIDELSKHGAKVICMQAQNPRELTERLLKQTKEFGKCQTLVINAHSNKQVLRFSDDLVIKANEIGEHKDFLRKLILKTVKPGGQIVLLGCYLGAKDGIADELKKILEDTGMNLFAIDEPTTPYDELIVDENGVREIQSVHFVVPPGTAYLPNDAPRKFYDKTHLKIK